MTNISLRKAIQHIVFTGPESTGKTSLAFQLSAYFHCPLVPEYARTYLNTLSRPYEASDLQHIARGQYSLSLHYERMTLENIDAGNINLLVHDTDLLTLYIWSMVKYGWCHPWILERLDKFPNKLYLLCKPDLEWSADPLREHPSKEDRLYLYREYQLQIEKLGYSYKVIEGKGDLRFQNVLHAIKEWLQ